MIWAGKSRIQFMGHCQIKYSYFLSPLFRTLSDQWKKTAEKITKTTAAIFVSSTENLQKLTSEKKTVITSITARVAKPKAVNRSDLALLFSFS